MKIRKIFLLLLIFATITCCSACGKKEADIQETEATKTDADAIAETTEAVEPETKETAEETTQAAEPETKETAEETTQAAEPETIGKLQIKNLENVSLDRNSPDEVGIYKKATDAIDYLLIAKQEDFFPKISFLYVEKDELKLSSITKAMILDTGEYATSFDIVNHMDNLAAFSISPAGSSKTTIYQLSMMSNGGFIEGFIAVKLE